MLDGVPPGGTVAPLGPERPPVQEPLPDRSTDAKFASVVAAVAAAFGDPTRREIFLYVRSHPGTSTAEVASAFSLHPNVARHHLQRLVSGGYLHVALGRRGQGAGRPAQIFFPVDEDPVLDLIGRRDDLLMLLLRHSLERLGIEEAERLAEAVGEEYGRLLADRMSLEQGRQSVRAAMHTIAATLTAHGFAAHAEDHGNATTVVAEHCPFGDPSTTPPVFCAVDRGMVRGLLAGLCGADLEHSMPVVLSSRALGDDSCAALA